MHIIDLVHSVHYVHLMDYLMDYLMRIIEFVHSVVHLVGSCHPLLEDDGPVLRDQRIVVICQEERYERTCASYLLFAICHLLFVICQLICFWPVRPFVYGLIYLWFGCLWFLFGFLFVNEGFPFVPFAGTESAEEEARGVWKRPGRTSGSCRTNRRHRSRAQVRKTINPSPSLDFSCLLEPASHRLSIRITSASHRHHIGITSASEGDWAVLPPLDG